MQMQTCKTITVSTLFGAALLFPSAACRPASESGIPGPPFPAAVAGAILRGPLSEPLFAESLFSGGSGPAGVGRWRPKRLWQVGGPKFDASTVFISFREILLPFEEAGRVRAFVVGSIHPPEHTCPLCSPIVGAMSLTDVTGGWRVDAVEPELGAWGGKGELTGEGSVVRLSPSRIALLLQMDVEADGKRESSLAFVVEKGKTLVEVLHLEGAGGSNRGSCGAGKAPCWEFGTVWSTESEKGKELWNLECVTSGTRPGEATTTPVEFSEKRSYTFKTTRYELVSGGPDA